MALKKIISISAVLVFTSQLVFANYAFYRQVVNTCKLYRMPVDEKKMSLTKKSDGSYQFTIEMQAKLRNDFETPMLVAFISVGQAIKHQENFAKKKTTYKPVIPNDTEVTVITTISREGMVISAKATPDQMKKLAEGKIDTASFMRLIKNSIQTL
ncbi:MAG: hypothetical protein CMG56_06950 [Candidatus Marinimicrobia bacterium]|nr:hypothetical protein [Candidatus Neomarinimicrobiota bacterium]|tara:strand:+ start:1163 stop:1627 length:465 start_codon:yes stop_codon:yes gene_type:complete